MNDVPAPLPDPQDGASNGQLAPELRELSAEFELEGELGRGGTAVVYRARDRALGRVVAIKVIRARYVDDDELVARLEREARLVARLDHPNVVSLLGVRRLGGGSLALIMRYVHGHTLREELQQRGALPLERARAVLDDIGRALAAAHAHGIVHRDVKPENIHVEHGASRALLADFGSATPLRDDMRLTVAGMAIGTPGYMAPELIDGGAATPASDVYSLGLVAWEMLAGRAPWEGDSLYAILSFRKHGTLPALHTLRPDVPRTVSEAVTGALRSDPAERWQDIHHFQQALARPVGRRWLPGTAARRSARMGAPPAGAGGGTPTRMVGDQDTVRIERPFSPASATPTGAIHAEPAPPVGALPEPPAPHPSAAIFAADDSDDELVEEAPAGRARRRLPVGLLAVVTIVLLVVAGTAFLRMLGREPRRMAALGANSDAPRSIAIQSSPTAGALSAGATSGATAGDPAEGPVAADSSDAFGGGITERAGDVERANAAPPADRGSALPTTAPPQPDPGTANPPGTAGTARTTAAGRTPPTPSSGRAASGANAIASRPRAQAPAPAPTQVEARANAEDAPSPAPPRTTRSTAVIRIALGGMHSCAVYADGRLGCWGADGSGQAGAPTGSVRFTSVASGLTHSCGRTEDGHTLCWGANEHGQLGDGSRAARSSAVTVRGGENQVALALGEASSCALTKSGGVSCWGANDAGQLGTGDEGAHDTPTPVAGEVRFTALVAGWRHFCALSADQRAYCWGDNDAGQLGDGSTTSHDVPTPVNSSLRFRELAAGRSHSCGITTTGTVYCWGRNDTGQLGTASRTDASTPRPVRVPGSAREIAAGSAHGCALLTDGSAYCWGQNRYGQLGDGTSIDRDAPVRVARVPVLAEIDASGAHSCGRDAQGQLYCWGYNVFGQLGDGSRRNRPLPVAIPPRS